MQYAYQILFAALCVAARNDNRVGVQSTYLECHQNGLSPSLYRVRQAFKSMRAAGIVRFEGNHYKVQTDSVLGAIADVTIELDHKVGVE